MDVLTIFLVIIGIAVSLGAPIGLTIGTMVFLHTAVCRFPADSKPRKVAMFIAIVTSVVSGVIVSYIIFEVYRPVFTKEAGATNGVILLLGPGFMSAYALIPAGAIGGLLMFWSWILTRNGRAT